MIININDNWFYDCSIMNNKHLYLYNPIIKVPLSAGIFYFEFKYLYSLFMSNNKIFFVYPLYTTIKNKNKEILERIKQTYDLMSQKYFTHATMYIFLLITISFIPFLLIFI